MYAVSIVALQIHCYVFPEISPARDGPELGIVYERVLSEFNEPVILHWLGSMFDPALMGYWGSDDILIAISTALSIICSNKCSIEGIKISLLDQQQEIVMRRKLPPKVRDIHRRRLQLHTTGYPQLMRSITVCLKG